MVGHSLDQHLACRHQALHGDHAGVAAPALGQHQVDLLYGVEAAEGAEHILVLGGVLLECSAHFTESSLQRTNCAVWPSTFPLTGEKLLNFPQTFSNFGSIW